jgi:rhamnogalacturonan endolyase
MMKIAFMLGIFFLSTNTLHAQRQMENLARGVVAVNQDDGKVYIGWRMFGTDPEKIAFNVYRDKTKINSQPITNSTNFVDNNSSADSVYTVRAVIDGQEGKPTAPAKVWNQNYISIPLQTPEGCTPGDASVGDLDGDGEYEIVLKQEMRPRDNSQRGTTGQTRLEAYKMGGTFMWRINLGQNIREGAHYTQFMVYDLDGDGRAEVACKTADGTVDGKGKVIGDPNANYVNDSGMILDGPEFLTIFDGKTGAELVTADYVPPRGGDGSGWGDSNGNRVDRFLACVAYLDGERPSLVMCRGYYTRAVLAAWNYRDNKLTKVWTFDSDDGTEGNQAYRGQGNHNLSVGDVDSDGKDEIIFGACAIDDDGTGLYSTGMGHGDAMHLSDIDPNRAGLEVWAIHENPRHPNGANLRDARTGEVIFGLELRDPGRGLAMDIDPRYPGYECWANNSDGLYSCKGEKISDTKPNSCNMGIWWDGDLLREILDGRGGGRRSGRGGAYIDKWDYVNGTVSRLLNGADYNCVTNNGSKANPCLCADIFGDWREEVIWRTTDGNELRIFTTTIPTEHRIYTLMHDPVYRLAVVWQNVAYNQPAHTGFYLGESMKSPPRPKIRLANKSD